MWTQHASLNDGEGPVATRTIHVEPDIGITDLVRQLSEDSKRLVTDEVQLAKLEVGQSVRTGTRGLLWAALAFGTAVIALVALTVLLATALGSLFGNLWAGTAVTGLLELGVGIWLVLRGTRTVKQAGPVLPASREELRRTGKWLGHPDQAQQP